MTEDLPDFLSDAPQAAPDAAPQAEAPAVAPAPQEVPASPPAEAAQPAPSPEAPPAPEPVAQHVPLATYLDMRDRAAANEKRAKELEAWRQQQEAAARQQPPPSREEDPDGYEQHRDQRFQVALYDQKLSFSERLAVGAHGKDAVAAAKTWYDEYANQDPYFDRKVASSADPYEVVIAEWKRQQLLTRIDPNDLDAFQAWKTAQAADPANPLNPTPAAPNAPPARPAAPRPSIAAAPSAGAAAEPEARDGEAQFRQMFS